MQPQGLQQHKPGMQRHAEIMQDPELWPCSAPRPSVPLLLSDAGNKDRQRPQTRPNRLRVQAGHLSAQRTRHSAMPPGLTWRNTSSNWLAPTRVRNVPSGSTTFQLS